LILDQADRANSDSAVLLAIDIIRGWSRNFLLSWYIFAGRALLGRKRPRGWLARVRSASNSRRTNASQQNDAMPIADLCSITAQAGGV